MIKEYRRADKQDQEEQSAKEKQRAKRKQEAEFFALKELKTIGVLGKGCFGLMTLVQDPRSKASYALNAIKKRQVELELQKHIIREKLVLD